jgi:hypothetical protein
MKKSVGHLIDQTKLEPGQRYILNGPSGEALVTLEGVFQGEGTFLIERGQLHSVREDKTYRRGDTYVLPIDGWEATKFYVPAS